MGTRMQVGVNLAAGRMLLEHHGCTRLLDQAFAQGEQLAHIAHPGRKQTHLAVAVVLKRNKDELLRQLDRRRALGTGLAWNQHGWGAVLPHGIGVVAVKLSLPWHGVEVIDSVLIQGRGAGQQAILEKEGFAAFGSQRREQPTIAVGTVPEHQRLGAFAVQQGLGTQGHPQ